MKFGWWSSGCDTRPAKGSRPARSEPCDGRGDAAGEASVRGRVNELAAALTISSPNACRLLRRGQTVMDEAREVASALRHRTGAAPRNLRHPRRSDTKAMPSLNSTHIRWRL